MKRTAISLAVAAAAGLAMSAQAGTVKTEGEDIIISTKNGGFSAKTESGDFSFKISGKLQWDYASFDGLYNADALGKDATKGYIRRGEIKLGGKAYGDYKYAIKLKIESDDNVKMDNAYLDFLQLDPVEVRVGKFGRTYGLENSVSSSWITGIERTFVLGMMDGDETNDYGIQAALNEKQYTVAVGLHHGGLTDAENDTDDTWGYTARATFAPIMTDDMIVHLGVNYNNNNPDKASYNNDLNTRLGVKKADKIKFGRSSDDGGWEVDGDTEYALEAAAQFSSLRLQGEYFSRQLDGVTANEDIDLAGYYAQVSFMVDGGKRSYKEGAFGKPKGGQWEVFARYSNMEIDADTGISNAVDTDKEIELDSYTVGVNYFATKNIRASVNYVTGDSNNLISTTDTYSNGKKEDSDGSAIVGRIQYVF